MCLEKFSLTIWLLWQGTPVTDTSIFGKDLWQKVAVALVSAILAFIGSYVLAQMKRRDDAKKRLSYDTETWQGLIAVAKEITEKVKVLYNGLEIKDLYYIACSVENTGNTVIKKQQIRFEFPTSVEIVDHFFDPEPQPEIGVERLKRNGAANERKFSIGHLDKTQAVGFRFIVTSPELPELTLHPFNEEGNVEFTPRTVSVIADERYHVRVFVVLFILFTVVPPVFWVIPFQLGDAAAGIVRFGILLFMLPHIKPFARAVTQLILRGPAKRTVEARVSIRELKSVERLDVQTESKE